MASKTAGNSKAAASQAAARARSKSGSSSSSSSAQSAADASALASMNAVRAAQGVALQTTVGEKASSGRSTPLSINKTTNEVTDRSGTVLAKDADLQEALALQTRISSGSAPTLSGRPDLLAVEQAKGVSVDSFVDPTLKTTITPRVASLSERTAQQNGTLQNYAKSQALTYLDGPTFSRLQSNLTEEDLVRENGRIYLKQGLTADQVLARGSKTTVAPTVPTEAIDVDLGDGVIDSTTLDEAVIDPKTEEDINKLIEQQKELQQEYLDEIAPSNTEVELKQQLVALHEDIRDYKQSLQAGLDKINDETIPMSFITGQQQSLENRASRQMQVYADEEANLLEYIGLEQEARQIRLQSKEMALQFFKDNVSLQFEIQDRIDAKADKAYQRARELKSDSLQSFTTMLDMLQGYDRTDMSDAAWMQLQEMAMQAGVPTSLLEEGLTAIKMQQTTESLGILSADQLSAYNTIADQMAQDSDVKTFVTIRDNYQKVVSGAELGSGVGDLAIVYGYMKMLDPTSVVREGEFATAENAGGIPEWIRNSYNKAATGERLSDDLRQEFIDGADSIYQPALDRYQEAYSYYSNIASAAGLSESILRNLNPSTGPGMIEVNKSYGTIDGLLTDYPELESTVEAWKQEGIEDRDILLYIEENGGVDFSSVGADTERGASIYSTATGYTSGDKAGQCGRFVNQIAGTRMGDTYASKMAYVNVNAEEMPKQGDVFVMPYSWTGHTGIVVGAHRLSDGTYDVDVVDSNWKLDERVRYHTINSSKLSGYARLS